MVSNQVGNARASRLGPSRRAWPLAITADTGQMQRWLVGLVPFRDLIASGHARLLGPSRLARAFPTWFDTTWFAEDLRRAEQRHRRQAEPA